MITQLVKQVSTPPDFAAAYAVLAPKVSEAYALLRCARVAEASEVLKAAQAEIDKMSHPVHTVTNREVSAVQAALYSVRGISTGDYSFAVTLSKQLVGPIRCELTNLADGAVHKYARMLGFDGDYYVWQNQSNEHRDAWELKVQANIAANGGIT